MSRHIITLLILLVSLLAAGEPALACDDVVPTQECCPNGPNAPCAGERARTPETTRLESCCAAGVTVATATAMAAPSNEVGQHRDDADPLALFVVLATLTSNYVLSPFVDEFDLLSPPLSHSPLYLSTGRLRL